MEQLSLLLLWLLLQWTLLQSISGMGSAAGVFLDVFNACNELSPESTHQNDRQQSWRKGSSHSAVESRKNYLSDVFLRIPVSTDSFPQRKLTAPSWQESEGPCSMRPGFWTDLGTILCCAISIFWKESSLSYVQSSQFSTVNSNHWSAWFSHCRASAESCWAWPCKTGKKRFHPFRKFQKELQDLLLYQSSPVQALMESSSMPSNKQKGVKLAQKVWKL